MTSPGEGITHIASAYNQAISDYASVAQEYREELENLIAAIKSGKMTADHALWLFQLTCMPDATKGCEYQMSSEADALNAASAIRNQIINANNAYNNEINLINNMQNNPGHTASAVAIAKSLYGALGQISNLIHNLKLTGMLGSSNANDIHGYIQQITNAINPAPNFTPAPGHTGQVIYTNINRMIQQAEKQGMPLPPQLNQIQSNFNNLNQSVSGVSSYIQTQMQYLNQNLQQYFSVYNNFFSDYNTLNAYIVSKSAGS